MRVFQITADSSCFAASDNRQSFREEIGRLLEYNVKGFVDLIKSDVLEKESEDLRSTELKSQLKNKTKRLATDYWAWFSSDHTGSGWAVGGGSESKFEEIYSTLFGETFAGETIGNKGKIRDAIHLDIHLINERDFFITLDKKHFLNKKEILRQKFNVEVMNPQECLIAMEAYWANDPGSDPRSRKNLCLLPPRIIAGTSLMPSLNLWTPEQKSIFSISATTDGFYFIQGIMYDSFGDRVCELEKCAIIRKQRAGLHTLSDPGRTGRIIICGKLYAHVILISEREKLLEAKVLGDGSLWVFGRFYNDKGQEIAHVTKEWFKLGPGPVCF